ncbi:MAG: hypothetical protein AAGB24_10975 [Bacteroidota bacterium]
MLEQVHFATQYLAMAGKSFLVPKQDDSHTNVGFNTLNQCFETWPINDAGTKLNLDLNAFALKWTGNSQTMIVLDGKTHDEVVKILSESSKRVGMAQAYQFDLHYELPFSWNGKYTFELKNSDVLNEISRLRTLANSVLHTFLDQERLTAHIRIWPHHFDTGAFVVLNTISGKSVGLGMATPDTMVDDHYFYFSGYQGHDSIATSNFKNLSLGDWKNEGFKGAILPASNVSGAQAVQFFQEALDQYLT